MAFYRLDGKQAVGWADEQIDRPLLAALLADPETICGGPQGEVIKAGNTARVIRTQWPTSQGTLDVACKGVRRGDWVSRLKSWLRSHPVLRCWRVGHLLQKEGIPTARPVAVILSRQKQGEWAGILATEWVSGGQTLNEWMRAFASQPAGVQREEYRALALSLARLIARLHGRGFRHRDLKDRNIIVRRAGEKWETILIDLEGVACCYRLSRRRRCRDIARLLTSFRQQGRARLTDFLRFLKTYLKMVEGTDRDWKSRWEEIRLFSDRKLARKASCRGGESFAKAGSANISRLWGH